MTHRLARCTLGALLVAATFAAYRPAHDAGSPSDGARAAAAAIETRLALERGRD